MLLKFILYFLVFLFVFRFIGKLLFGNIVRQHNVHRPRHDNRKEGEVTVDSNNLKNQQKKADREGEYVDFDELD